MNHVIHLPLLFILGALVSSASEFKFHGIFQDHLVLQRSQPIPVFGFGRPGSEVSVGLDEAEKVFAHVNEEGRWVVTLAARPAGGVHKIVATSEGQLLEVFDVVFGDVWLASGQSNMAYKVGEGVAGDPPLKAIRNPSQIREFTVDRTPSGSPREEILGRWKVCSAETVSEFSAVALYFAREVSLAENVPVGIINASWGGSPIEAWLDASVLAKTPHAVGVEVDPVQLGYTSLEELHAANELKAEILVQRTNPLVGHQTPIEAREDYNDSDWSSSQIPQWLQLNNQVYWLRRYIDLPGDESAELVLGKPESSFNLYLNGVEIASGSNKECVVSIEKGKLKKGRNLLSVRIANPWWPPFFDGGANCFFLRTSGQSYDLSSDWRVSGAQEPALPVVHALQKISTGSFNGMIHPLRGVKLKGVLWYQGENNGDQGGEYRALLSGMIGSWRALFKDETLPFILVQLANFGESNPLPEYGGWPILREAQAEVAKAPGVGMAVTIDVGEALDIHPKNKEAVGCRMAQEAGRVVYGRKVARSPQFESLEIDGACVTLRFSDSDGLFAKNGDPVGFSIAGSDRVFYPARASVRGADIVLESNEVKQPEAVRYGWAKNPVVSIFNGAGLPLAPFRTDSWPFFDLRRDRVPYPHILYWKWLDSDLDESVLERKIDDICARSGFDTLYVSLHWVDADFHSDLVQKGIRRADSRLRAHGRRLLMDIDVRTEFAAASRANISPSGFASFLELDLDSNGSGRAVLDTKSVHRFGRKGCSQADRILAGWLFSPGDQGVERNYEPIDLNSIVTLEKMVDGKVSVSVNAGSQNGSKRVLLYPHYPHVVPDLFDPKTYDYFRTMLTSVADVPLAGVSVDEWGQAPIFYNGGEGMYLTEIPYSAGIETAYSERFGSQLTKDLLHLRYGPESARTRVINQYIEILRKGFSHGEAWLYRNAKELWGAEAFVGTHPTWAGGGEWISLEVLQNGLDWWETPRDFAQTDENVLMPIRLALAHKAGKPVWYNMFYSAGSERLDSFFSEAWSNVLFGGRTHYLGYECLKEPGVCTLAKPGYLETAWSIEERLAKLDLVQKAAPDSRVLVLFGYESCTSWEFSRTKTERFGMTQDNLVAALHFGSELFQSTLCDIVPTSEIQNGSLRWEGQGLRYGTQHYDAVILVSPEQMPSSVYDWFESKPSKLPLFVFGRASHNSRGDECEAAFNRLVETAMWHEPLLPTPTIVSTRLLEMGVKPNRFANGCMLQNGAALFSSSGTVATGNLLVVEEEVNGHRLKFNGEDFLHIKIESDGTVKDVAFGRMNFLSVDGRRIW